MADLLHKTFENLPISKTAILFVKTKNKKIVKTKNIGPYDHSKEIPRVSGNLIFNDSYNINEIRNNREDQKS